MMVRADYAANAGDRSVSSVYGPDSIEAAKTFDWKGGTWEFDKSTGVSFLRSRISVRDVTDGTSHTYLVGEKYIDADQYASGLDASDDSVMYQGQDVDVCRWTPLEFPPKQDTRGYTYYWGFGSARPAHAISSSATARSGRSATRSIPRRTAAWAIAKTARPSTRPTWSRPGHDPAAE